MRIPKGFFIDVTNIPLEDRLKLFPQFENNCCRRYLEHSKWCLAVNRTGTVETYSTNVEGDGCIPRYKSNLIRDGLQEMYFTDLGGL